MITLNPHTKLALMSSVKHLSELLDSKVSTINSFKYTEEHFQARFSSRLKENLENQVQKWNKNKDSPPSLAYLEVQIESFKQLKAEAMKISTKVEWTP